MLTVESVRRQFECMSLLLKDADAAQKVRAGVAQIAEALAPFASMTVTEFADFLRLAEEYRITGKLASGPVKAPRGKSAKIAESPALIAEQVAKLNELYAVVHEETVGRGAIDEVVAEISRFKKDAIVAIAQGFEIRLTKSVTIKKAVEEIRRKLENKKSTAERNIPIEQGWS